jgi:hypothetical protein
MSLLLHRTAGSMTRATSPIGRAKCHIGDVALFVRLHLAKFACFLYGLVVFTARSMLAVSILKCWASFAKSSRFLLFVAKSRIISHSVRTQLLQVQLHVFHHGVPQVGYLELLAPVLDRFA